MVLRCLRIAAWMILPFLSTFLIADDKQSASGTWSLDASKSSAPSDAIDLTIEDAGGKVHFIRIVHSNGKDITSTFDCAAGGPDCPFDDGGHKSKVSLWYQGGVLVVLMTDGPADDEVSQWSLKPDKGSLTVEVSHITPAKKTENLVFAKKK